MGIKILSSSQRVKLLWHNVDKSMWWHNVEKFDPVLTPLFLLSHKVEDTVTITHHLVSKVLP